MLKYLKQIVLICLFALSGASSYSQYYQIASQLPDLIRPALSGSMSYKGFVDASYLVGVGNRNIDFVGVSTSQGFKYKDWFYMGVGIGVDVAISHTNKGFGGENNNPYWNHKYSKTAVLIPLFTDFRFNIGKLSSTAFFIDAKIGASFLMGSNYLAVADGFITNKEYFYLKPSMGVRIPIGGKNNKAINVGVVYQLLTSNYWYNTPSSYNVTLSSVGVTASFEW